MNKVTVRSSTIFVAVGGEDTRVYQSVEQVPAALRRKLVESTNGVHSATILIADRGGREEIARALRGLPSRVRSRLIAPRAAPSPRKPRRLTRGPLWLEILIPGALGLGIWLLFALK